MKCPNCHFDNPDGAKFCIECGNKLEHICPNCNSPYPHGSKFCPECGYHLIESSEVSTAQQTDQFMQTVEASNVTPPISQVYAEGERNHVTDHNLSGLRPEVIRKDAKVKAVPEKPTLEAGQWECSKCGSINGSARIDCWNCGQVKAEIASKTSVHTQGFQYSEDFTSLTKFLKIMLWILAGVALFKVISDFTQMNLLNSGYFTQAEVGSNDSRQRTIAILHFGTFIITFIAFLKWTYQANTNCHGFGAQGMKFSPGWSIGYYFIPILNLFRPFQTMKEIWKVSKNPLDWQNQEGSALLGWWWTLWLTSAFLIRISVSMSRRATTISSIKTATLVSIVAGIIFISACIVAVSLITAVSNMQEQLTKENL